MLIVIIANTDGLRSKLCAVTIDNVPETLPNFMFVFSRQPHEVVASTECSVARLYLHHQHNDSDEADSGIIAVELPQFSILDYDHNAGLWSI